MSQPLHTESLLDEVVTEGVVPSSMTMSGVVSSSVVSELLTSSKSGVVVVVVSPHHWKVPASPVCRAHKAGVLYGYTV